MYISGLLSCNPTVCSPHLVSSGGGAGVFILLACATGNTHIITLFHLTSFCETAAQFTTVGQGERLEPAGADKFRWAQDPSFFSNVSEVC